MDLFAEKLAEMQQAEADRQAPKGMWLSHHWPVHHDERCVLVGQHQVCRRCSALYPIGFAVAGLSAAGLALWPDSWDPGPIWLLSIPATIAYVGEALGWFRYRSSWQVMTMLIAALGFGRGLGYELIERWHPYFWQPVATFGTIWMIATLINHQRR